MDRRGEGGSTKTHTRLTSGLDIGGQHQGRIRWVDNARAHERHTADRSNMQVQLEWKQRETRKQQKATDTHIPEVTMGGINGRCKRRFLRDFQGPD